MSKNIFNTVVYFLGAALILSIGGVIALNFFERPVDDILKQVIVGALTGIAGILATGRQEVTVNNTRDNPVAVDPT